MANRKIHMYEYRHIIYRLREGQSVRTIAKETLAGRHKIQAVKVLAITQGWLAKDSTLPDDKMLATVFENKPATQAQPLAAPYADEITKWAEQGVSAQVIHQHLAVTYGYKGAYNSVQRFVKKLKDQQAVKLTVPLDFKPGEAAQVDFGKGPRLFDERLGKEVDTWFFIMTLCWSRHQYVEMVTHQDIETWLTCHQKAFNWFGGVVGKVIIDNAKCAITKACYYDPEVQRSYSEFAQEYGFIISACPPRDPKKKGRVESGVKYVKRNFFPLRTRESLQKTHQQLLLWITSTAGNRIHGAVFEKPLTRFEEIEKLRLKPLPATLPEIAVWQQVPLYKDCHVRYLKCLYSAPHHLYGEPLWLKVSATTVSVYHQHVQVALHPRLFKPGKRSTKQEHLPPNAQAYLQQDANWCKDESKAIGEHCQFVVESLLTDPVRDLLRQAQSVIALSKSYGLVRLEMACLRAVFERRARV